MTSSALSFQKESSIVEHKSSAGGTLPAVSKSEMKSPPLPQPKIEVQSPTSSQTTPTTTTTTTTSATTAVVAPSVVTPSDQGETTAATAAPAQKMEVGEEVKEEKDKETKEKLPHKRRSSSTDQRKPLPVSVTHAAQHNDHS